MEGFTGFAAAFCGVCVALGGVGLLLPKGTMSKSVGYLLCLVFLSVLLASALGVKRFSPEFSEFKPASVSVDDMSAAAAKMVFEQTLKNGGINFSKCEVCTDKNEDGRIIIIEVIVYSSDPAQSIRELIGGSDTYEVTVINE